MEFSTWLLFLSIALVATISPGPAVLLSVTNCLRHGFMKSIFSSFGNVVGIFIVSGASALGLGAVLQGSAFLFATFKTAGAIYLIYVGVRQWQSKQNLFEKSLNTFQGRHDKGQSFVQGLFVALSNPKAILFFTALFPQFIDTSKPIVTQFIILTVTFMLLSFIVLIGYALFVNSAKGWLIGGNRIIWLNRISGTVFIAFGLGILRIKNSSA